jgi:hypothetical protein
VRRQDKRILAGLLCRWALLAMVAAVACWAAVLAAASVERESSANLTPSDALWSSQRPTNVIASAWSDVAADFNDLEVALGFVPGGPIRMLKARDQTVVFVMPTPPAGVYPIRIEGIGYGPLAFLQTTCRLVALPPDHPVWLIDATAVQPALKARPPEVAALLAELKRHGMVACYHEGPLPAFAELVDDIRRLDRQVLILRDREKDAHKRIVYYLQRKGAQYPYLVTGRADLARTAAAAKFVTYLIDPAATETEEVYLRTYATLSALTEHLREDRLTVEDFRPPATRPAQPASEATSRP